MPSLKFVRLLVVFAAWVVVSDAFAQEAPSPEDISRAIREQVPSFWTVDEVRITASVNLGDPVEPNIKQRFEAVATPAVDLFVPDSPAAGSFAPFLPLLPTAAGGSHRTLYGVATSTYRAGAWTVQITVENPVADLGNPADLFSQPTIVRGSEAEKAFAERLRTNIVADARTALETALAETRTDQARAIEQLEADQRNRLAELKRTQDEQIVALQAEIEASRPKMQTALDTLERDYAGRLTVLRERHAKEQAELARQLEADLTAANQRHTETLASLEREHAAAVEKLKTEIRQQQELLQLEQQRQKAIDEVAAAQMAALEKEQKAAENQHTAQVTAQARAEAMAQERRAQEAKAQQAAQNAHIEQFRDLEVTLSGNDHKTKLAALEQAVNEKDSKTAAMILDVLLAVSDPKVRSAALQLGLKTEDFLIKQRIIRAWINAARNLGAAYEGIARSYNKEVNQGSFSISMLATKVDGDVVNFTGNFKGGIFRKETFEEEGSGSFFGTQLTFGNSQCNLLAEMNEAMNLEGRLTCNSYNLPISQTGSVDIKIPVGEILLPVQVGALPGSILVGSWKGNYQCRGARNGTMEWNIKVLPSRRIIIDERWSEGRDAGSNTYEGHMNEASGTFDVKNPNFTVKGSYDQAGKVIQGTYIGGSNCSYQVSR
jgi:hypothetical protein